MWPVVLKTSSSHEEGCIRRWCLTSNKFIGEKGQLKAVEVEEVEWKTPEGGGRPQMVKTGKVETIECDLVFLALGFVNPVQDTIVAELGLAVNERKNIAVDAETQRIGSTNAFAAGDAISGASLVVRALASGHKAAAGIDAYLQK
jgi:glutamate synthase (NADPH/NADH) small chain